LVPLVILIDDARSHINQMCIYSFIHVFIVYLSTIQHLIIRVDSTELSMDKELEIMSQKRLWPNLEIYRGFLGESEEIDKKTESWKRDLYLRSPFYLFGVLITQRRSLFLSVWIFH
jgi:hypothetical protein